MVRFIKVVNTFDKIFDCIPVASSVKNAGIFLCQLTHKVNKVANPVNTSWKDDIKIHVLSKDDFIAGISMIPIAGNLIALAYHLANALAKARGMWMLGGQRGYLMEATRAFSWGLKKHSYEVVALYLARNPNLSEKKLRKALIFSASRGKEEIVKLILDSRSSWTSDSIEEILKFTKDTKTAKIILKKCSDTLTDEQAGSIVCSLASNFMQNNHSLIELLITTYPNIDINEIGLGLEKAAGKKDGFDIVCLFLERFPEIEEKYKANALDKASEKGFKGAMEVLLQNCPNLLTTHRFKLIEKAASRGDRVILNWLFSLDKENVSSTSIGKALAAATENVYCGEGDEHLLIIEGLVNGYPNLPGQDLEPVMERAASLNIGLFKFYLNKFSQLQPENLQKILNEAVFIYGKSYEDIPTHSPYSKQWSQVAQLIKEKFPNMEAVDPYGEFL